MLPVGWAGCCPSQFFHQATFGRRLKCVQVQKQRLPLPAGVGGGRQLAAAVSVTQEDEKAGSAVRRSSCTFQVLAFSVR